MITDRTVQVACICRDNPACPICHGSTLVTKPACGRCDGKGTSGGSPCLDCRGNGWRDVDLL